jgi:nucleoside-diphosphate-sugar epimerase
VKVLVAGCGDLGTEVGLRLVAAGHEVVGLRRDPSVLPSELVPLAGDLTRPLPSLPGDLDAVVHTPAAGRRDEATYRAVYLDGLRRVLEAVSAGTDRPRVLFVSSTAVYGVEDGSEVDESTPTEPTSPTGRVLADAERALADAGVQGIALRLAGIYGPGRTRLVDRVRAGEARLPAAPVHANRIHRDDAAEAVVHLLTRVPQPAPCYLGVDDAPVDRGEVLRFLAAELGVPVPPVAAKGDGRDRGGDKRCRNDRLRAAGWVPTFPTYREGYRAVLRGDGHRHP